MIEITIPIENYIRVTCGDSLFGDGLAHELGLLHLVDLLVGYILYP